MRGRGLLAAATVGLMAAGCSATPDTDRLLTAVHSFVEALDSGDGAAACALLTDNARSSATGATAVSCAEAIVSVHLTREVTGKQIWGDAAQVRLGDDVLFLRLNSGQWKVSAAGCTRQPVGPYDCKVGG